MRPDQRAQWRAYLAARFAAEEYDEHRANIIEHLCSDFPQYSFVSGELAYVVSWWTRDRQAPAVVRIYSALFAAI